MKCPACNVEMETLVEGIFQCPQCKKITKGKDEKAETQISKKIEKELLDIKSYYSGKKKKNSYLDFIEKVSFNEDDIVNKIQDSLIKLREKLIKINNEISELTKKQVKLLNLDFERYVLTH